MLKFLALLMACVAATTAARADRSDERWRMRLVAPACETAPDVMACIAAEIEKLAPCIGTVEERLACLDRKMAAQGSEIYLLRRQIEERTSPQVRPLGSATDQIVR
jgi:hypothetical protein